MQSDCPKFVTGCGDAGGAGRGAEEDERLREGGTAAAAGDRARDEGPQGEGQGARQGAREVSLNFETLAIGSSHVGVSTQPLTAIHGCFQDLAN